MKFTRHLAFCAPIFFAASSVAHAADGTWISTTGGNWTDNATKWSSNVIADGATSTANFTSDIAGPTSVSLNGVNRTIGNIVFDDSGIAPDSAWTITGNTLQLGDNGGATSTPTITTVTNATISSTITGNDGLTKEGNGTLILSNTGNNLSGTLVINAGTLDFATAAPGGGNTPMTLNTVIGGSGALKLSSNGALAADTVYINSGTISGSGVLEKAGTGYLSLFAGSNISGFTGTINVTAGTLGNNGANWGTGTATLNVGTTFDVRTATVSVNKLTGSGNITTSFNSGNALVVGGAGGSSTFNGGIGGVLAFTKTGAGTLTLGGNNTYSGGTTINAGTLEVTTGGVINGGQVVVGNLNGSTGTLTLSGGTVTTSSGALFYIGNSGTTAGVANVNAGTLNIGTGAAQTYVGSVTTGSLNIAGGTVNVAVGSNTDTTRALWVGVAGTGTTNLNSGTLSTARDIAHFGTGSGTFNFDGGTLKLASGYTSNAGGLLSATSHASGAALVTNVKVGGARIDTNSQNASITTSLLHDSGLGATPDGGLTKSGTGTLTLTNSNTFTGATTVQQGTLTLGAAGTISNTLVLGVSSGTVGNLDVTAKDSFSQATVSGSGTLNIGAGKTINVTTALAPGFSPGTVNVTGNLSLVNGSNNTATTMELAGLGGVAGTDSDFVNITGSLTVDGLLAIVGYGIHDTTQIATYNLFDATSVTGNFDGVNIAGNNLIFASDVWSGSFGGKTYSFSENTGVLTVVPEPAAALLGSLGLLVLLRRRRA